MANSNTYIRDGFVSAGSAQITGSLGVTGGITGSLQGTASYATQALSASYAPSAVGATFPFTGSAVITGSLIVTGSLNNNGRINVGGVYAYSPTSSGITIVAPNESADYKGILEIFSNTTGANNGGSIVLGGMQTGPTMYTLAKIVSGYVGSGYGGYLSFWTELVSSTTTEKMRITSIGLVGIGTTTPTAVLHLKAGTATANTAPIKLTAGTNLTTPEAGAVEFDGNSLFFTTGSTRSTILTNINPAGITGSISIVGGTDGSNSTFIGTSGVVIGKGKVPTLENIFIGSGSLNTQITTGTQNYCFGLGSGNSITSGIYNVLMGPSAGASINSGQSNVFLGRQPGYRTSTGGNNIALGNTTLYYNTTTSDNIAIGSSALQGSNANTGARNIGIGSEAGYAILTGNNNICIGYRAGTYISDGVTTALVYSASIFLGAETRPLSSSQTNQIVIGHGAIGLGSNTVVIGNNSITTTSLKGNTQVSGSLSVSGSTTTTGNVSVTGNLSSTAKYILGSDLSLTPIAGNQSVLTSWWGLQLVGNKQSTVDYTPSAIGNNSDFSVIIPNQQAAKIGLIVRGQTSQTGNLLELRNVSNTGLSAFDSTGQLALGKTTPTTTLDVNGNAIVSGSLTVTGSFNVTGLTARIGNTTLNGNLTVTGSLLVSGSSLVAGFNTIPLAGTIKDGVTSVLGDLNDWNSNFYQGDVLYSETAAGTITFGQLCYRTQNETWELADASVFGAASTYMLGICVKSSTATNPTSILINGFVETATYAAILKTGEPLYMTTTPGSMSKSVPAASGNIVRIIGHTFWDSNTNTKIIIRFNPENSWIELT